MWSPEGMFFGKTLEAKINLHCYENVPSWNELPVKGYVNFTDCLEIRSEDTVLENSIFRMNVPLWPPP